MTIIGYEEMEESTSSHTLFFHLSSFFVTLRIHQLQQKRKDSPATAATTTTVATASAKNITEPTSSTSTASNDTIKVVTKDLKEKVQTKVLKAKQLLVRGNQFTRKHKIHTSPRF
ncbi:unnamed protein product [Rotaria sp. Silwood2]|nr:unnamed protein product [Rotaria sp. Silwood2]CAF4527406.1 unnamed protein product [Rotaria sp. Silwood2]